MSYAPEDVGAAAPTGAEPAKKKKTKKTKKEHRKKATKRAERRKKRRRKKRSSRRTKGRRGRASSSSSSDDDPYSRGAAGSAGSAFTTGRTLALLAFIVIGVWQLFAQQRLSRRSRSQRLRGASIQSRSDRSGVGRRTPKPRAPKSWLPSIWSRDPKPLAKEDFQTSKCACQPGQPRDGGKPVDNFGECHFCCSPHHYCGTGKQYCRGSFTNCMDGKGGKGPLRKKHKLPAFEGTLEEVAEAPPGVRAPDLVLLSATLEWREDGKCGPGFPSKRHVIAACDPRGVAPCCSQTGLCGNTKGHCMSQMGGHDYRISFQGKQWQEANRDLAQTGALVAAHDENLKITPHQHYHLHDAPVHAKEWESGTPAAAQAQQTQEQNQYGIKFSTLLVQGAPKVSHMGIEWREDGRCGKRNPTRNRAAAGCNPESHTPCCRAGKCRADCDQGDGLDFRTISKGQLRPFKLHRNHGWHGPMEHVAVCGAWSTKEPRLPPQRARGMRATLGACKYFKSVFASSRRSHHLVELLNMLDFLNEEFAQLGGQFSLAHGTFLGAVRHGTFIPWDDDVDVHIRAQDAALFQELIKNSNGKYCVARFWGGFKLFPCKAPPYDNAARRKLSWRYPFIDVWDQMHDTSGAKYKGGQNMCITPPCCSGKQIENLVFPTKPMKFAGKIYPAPRYPMRYLRSKWGPHVKELWQDCRASTWDHSTEKTKPVSRPYAGRGVSCMSLPAVCVYPKGTDFLNGRELMENEQETEWEGGKVVYMT